MITHNRAIILPDWACKPVEENMDGWPVVQRFEPPEAEFNVGLADLTHRPKALVHGPEVERLGELTPGQVLWTGKGFVGCIKTGEAAIFDLIGPMEPSWPDYHFTDMTDAWVLFSIWGLKAVEILQRLFPVDLDRPTVREPFYLVTRWHTLVVQILNVKGHEPGFFLATDRSHGQNLFDGLIHAGRHLGLRPFGLRT